ncbi:hypothetical protein E2C01_032491 [Portunus trituberculatus]|uniref:Uncharacterized protein n=1 Tax=Portunus trituberculatus TaxID=210409 RepID=A0A5B7EXM9_PORTR|nr:hypothetical protein [Portunus trituberculatus]
MVHNITEGRESHSEEHHLRTSFALTLHRSTHKIHPYITTEPSDAGETLPSTASPRFPVHIPGAPAASASVKPVLTWKERKKVLGNSATSNG